MKDPLVSIVMPVYNSELYIDAAIFSILNQTYQNIEFIIINDGSSDHSKDRIEAFKDSRIIFINHEYNLGNYIRRNEGCKIAVGKYVCVMDSDDIAELNRIETQVDLLERDPQLLAAGSDFQYIGGGICKRPPTYELSKILLLFNNVFLHPSLIIRRNVLDQIGYYDESYKYAADYNLICNIALIGNVLNVEKVLLHYRLHKSQISSMYYPEQRECANRIRINYLEHCGFLLDDYNKMLFTALMNKEAFQYPFSDIVLLVEYMIHKNKEINFFHPVLFNQFANGVLSFYRGNVYEKE